MHPIQRARREAVVRHARQALDQDEAARWYATGEPRLLVHRRSFGKLAGPSRSALDALVPHLDFPAMWLRRPIPWHGTALRGRTSRVLLTPLRLAKPNDAPPPWLVWARGRTRQAVRAMSVQPHRHPHIWAGRPDLYDRRVPRVLDEVPAGFDDAMVAGRVADAFAACGVDVHPELIALAEGDVVEAVSGRFYRRHPETMLHQAFTTGPVWQQAAAWLFARMAPWKLAAALERAEHVDPEPVRLRGTARRLINLPAVRHVPAAIVAYRERGRVRIRMAPADREEYLPEVGWTRDIEDEMRTLEVEPGHPVPRQERRHRSTGSRRAPRVKKLLRLFDAGEVVQALHLARSLDPSLIDQSLEPIEICTLPGLGSVLTHPRFEGVGAAGAWVLVELLALAESDRTARLRASIEHLQVHGGHAGGTVSLACLHRYPALRTLTLLRLALTAGTAAPLPRLTGLTLAGPPTAVLASLPELRDLRLLGGRAERWPSLPPKLESLELHGSNLPPAPSAPSLRRLLVTQLFDAAQLAEFAPHLRHLEVSRRPLPSGLEALRSLRVLDIEGAANDGAHLAHLSQLVAYRGGARASAVIASPSRERLRAVALRGTIDGDLSDLPAVEHLDLSRSDVHDFGFVARMPRLHTLVLDAYAAGAAAALPGSASLRRVRVTSRAGAAGAKVRSLPEPDLRGWSWLQAAPEAPDWTWATDPDALPCPSFRQSPPSFAPR